MTKTWDDWKREAEEKCNEDRKRLLAISDVDALKLSHPEQYQRMRYQREIEAANWLTEVRRNLPPPVEKVVKSKPLKQIYKTKWSD